MRLISTLVCVTCGSFNFIQFQHWVVLGDIVHGGIDRRTASIDNDDICTNLSHAVSLKRPHLFQYLLKVGKLALGLGNIGAMLPPRGQTQYARERSSGSIVQLGWQQTGVLPVRDSPIRWDVLLQAPYYSKEIAKFVLHRGYVLRRKAWYENTSIGRDRYISG